MMNGLRDRAAAVDHTLDNAQAATKGMHVASMELRSFIDDARMSLLIITAAAVASAVIVAACAVGLVDKLNTPTDG